MLIFTYLLSFIIIAGQILIPVYLLVSMGFVIVPLLTHFVNKEKFRYYEGLSATKLGILFTLLLLSLIAKFAIDRNLMSSISFDSVLNLIASIAAQLACVMLFEGIAPITLGKKIKSIYKSPKMIFSGDNLVFIEPEKKVIINQVGCAYLNSEAAQSKVNFKERTKIEIGDIFLNIERSKYDEIIKEYEKFFKDTESIENLYRLSQGAKIEYLSIKMCCANKESSKNKIAELLISLFEIKKNWNSIEKGRTNTQKVDFFNKYILIDDDKNNKLHYNNFSRSL